MDSLQDDIALLETSDYFDRKWYLTEYPDVAMLGVSPAEHFLRYGARLLRNPSARFDTSFYLNANKDVEAADMNPLVHFLRHGRSEGRAAAPYVPPVEEYTERVDVVVPVFNALEHVKLCLESIKAKQDGYRIHVIVVNDGSDEATSSWLRAFCRANDQFELVAHPHNLGYTKAINSGLKMSTAPFVACLNSDTVVTSGWLRAMVRCITSVAGAGIVGPLSNAASWQNVPALTADSGGFAINVLPAGMTPDEMAQIVANASSQAYPSVPFLNGFCMLIRREVINAIGFMDEQNFPLGYGEENDYCIRATDAGFTLAVADDAYVFHAKSKSFGDQRRKELSGRGDIALKQKHTAGKVDTLVEKIRSSAQLATIRASVVAELRSAAPTDADILSARVLFLLPVKGGGGGAHSAVQEAAAMRRIGVDARVAVPDEHLANFKAEYADLNHASELFIGFGEKALVDVAKDFHIAIATIFSSVAMLREVVAACPHILPAYYVQDYEPLFFAPNTKPWNEARDSYTLIPGATLFAKTRWLAEKLRAEHGIPVNVVIPSVDHDLFKPAPKPADGTVKISAMIRPQTPRRGADRTMRVLSRVAQLRPGKVSFTLFGCADVSAEFPVLSRDFKYRDMGVLKRRDVAALLAASDVFVDLSDYQAFGRSAVEAMACGCTAMVPVHGGTDEYAIDGVNALVVDSQNEGACINRLLAVIDDAGSLRTMQFNAIRAASRFTMHAAAVSELAVLRSAQSKRRQVKIAESAAAPRNAVARPAPKTGKLPLTALVITWDVGHNPLGRSYMLAEVLDRVVRNVVTVGFQFEKYGRDIWEPVRDGRLPVISLPGQSLPELLTTFDRIAERVRPDIVIACKPRLPSVQLAATIKEKFGCPMILDIDDHELSFFKGAREFTMDDLAKLGDGAAANDVEPYSALWTQLTQHLRKFADEIIVSNVALEAEFGGTVVPHVRDESVFDPDLYSRDVSRDKYGVPRDARVVLFFGTPRHHKGINVLAEAVNQITNEAFKLVIVGSTTDKSVTAKLDKLAPGRITYLPNQPFAAIPEILAMADVVCLPQDEENEISKYQLPAKAIDAVAMGIPLLVTRTEPLMQLVGDGVAVPVSIGELPRIIEETAGSDEARRRWSSAVRPRFLKRYSYAASAEAMREVINRALRRNDKSRTADLGRLLVEQRRVLGIPKVTSDLGAGTDVVVFWKQNDSSVYGRRSDMVIKYLAARPDVRRVIVFDAPISEHDLLIRRNKVGKMTHDRLLYVKTYEKVFGKLDDEKVSYQVFVYPPGRYATNDANSDRPRLSDAYLAYLEQVFQRMAVVPSEAVFWIYPKNYIAPAIIDRFAPGKVVVDVVDDHRAWPGISETEKQRLTENYRAVLQRGDMAFANCEPVQKAMSGFFPGIRLVPNGCDLTPPSVKPINDREYEEFLNWKGKTIGFVGNLEAKIDVALLGKVAEHFPDCQLVLIGSTHANPKVLELKQYPNVRMPGIVPYEQVGAWLSRFDVGIIPHLDIEMTRSMNPLKLYVYLSWGIPVVSTEIFNIDLKSNCVYQGSEHSEFLRAVGEALQQPRPCAADLANYANANSWEARLEHHVTEALGVHSLERQTAEQICPEQDKKQK